MYSSSEASRSVSRSQYHEINLLKTCRFNPLMGSHKTMSGKREDRQQLYGFVKTQAGILVHKKANVKKA